MICPQSNLLFACCILSCNLPHSHHCPMSSPSRQIFFFFGRTSRSLALWLSLLPAYRANSLSVPRHPIQSHPTHPTTTLKMALVHAIHTPKERGPNTQPPPRTQSVSRASSNTTKLGYQHTFSFFRGLHRVTPETQHLAESTISNLEV